MQVELTKIKELRVYFDNQGIMTLLEPSSGDHINLVVHPSDNFKAIKFLVKHAGVNFGKSDT